ncbi:MAG: DoxX family protein [Candidatus Jorgensenbacteria bacterium GW2011_GWA1_48_11]|uniref:DoxX family protein n=1 Tax=Candidatus Jorgensenbacteria bacterium GW2011_GWA1_48_11 TaxID=1618660 RepID=A0A0G1UBV2_9BACT|nr:MAG: DoxX family protein [Candidatus Jorgensenbacteria bacterium GW2011_GWA1_48_11]KKW12128.1 MAG: DoxX family protein [Candidatus Jorgensenbacteria bacterium GW2011_GWB1_49_9]
MIQPLLVFSDWGIFILRVALGLILVAQGWPKIKNIKNMSGRTGETFKPGILGATAASLTEFVGGLCLIFGFLTQVAAFFVAIEFLAIIFKVKKEKSPVDGFELNLLVLASALILLTLGSGGVSLDNYLGILLY